MSKLWFSALALAVLLASPAVAPAASPWEADDLVDLISEPYQGSTDKSVAEQCRQMECSGKVVVTENGNQKYAWYYLTNKGDKDASVTIKRWWLYNNKWRSDTKRHRLYPGQHKEVFSFPRNQNPKCCILACAFE